MSALDMERICRLCCVIKSRLRPLFDQRQEYPLPLSQMIDAITDLKVGPTDGLPQNICLMCISNVLKMYKTIQNYRKNDLFLKKQLNRVKSDDGEDMMEIEEISLKQEVVEEELESVLESKPMNATDEKQHAAIEKEKIQVDLDICIKKESLDELNEETQLDNTDSNTIDENEPIPQRKLENLRIRTANATHQADNKCYICNSESHQSASALFGHLNGNHMDLLPFTCPDCVMEKVVLNTLLTLNRHLRMHSYPHKCPHCDKRYPVKGKLTFHVQQYHRTTKDDGDQQSPAQCDQCEKLISKSSLEQHVRLVHSVSTTVSCAICGTVFDNKKTLRIHLERKHGQNRKQFECNICQKKYTSSQILERHVKTIHLNSSQQFKCSYCSKEHSTELAKRAHERRHIRNADFKTRQTWTQYFTLVEDQEDSKRRKGKCNICGKIARNISEHIQESHFPVDRNCDICGRNFKRRSVLRRHKRTHYPVQSSELNGEQIDADEPKQEVEEIEADAEDSNAE